MKKIQYIAPSINVTKLTMTNNILVVSGGETLGYGGDTNTNNVTESDTKYERPDAYNVWDDDWSK